MRSLIRTLSILPPKSLRTQLVRHSAESISFHLDGGDSTSLIPHTAYCDRMPRKVSGAKVREACREDIREMVSVWESSVKEEEVIGFGGPSEDSPFRNAERLASAWKDPNLVGSERVFVAEVDGLVAGVVTVEDRGKELELINIDVSRTFQRRGIGTKLVEFVERMALEDGKEAVTLGTSRNAEGVAWKALPWWQSRGYRITHEEENAWTRSIGPGAREIRMRKNLSTST